VPFAALMHPPSAHWEQSKHPKLASGQQQQQQQQNNQQP